ncbi:MAG: hypothetical protein FWD21_02005, partial [Peptococcaceae bacterium]|nr:hypothetical protein [Peptococcaceae bacterium]
PNQAQIIEKEAASYDINTLVSIIEEIAIAGNSILSNANLRLLLEGLFLRINTLHKNIVK